MFNKISNLIDYFRYLKNPIQVLLFKFGLKKESEIKVKNITDKIILKNETELNRLMILLTTAKTDKYSELVKYIEKIDANNEIVSIGDINYINIYNTDFKNKNKIEYNICIEEYFSGDSWDMLDLNNRDIIDIGANIADTALYFAKNGANVIAFEPVKHLYELGLENIYLNSNLKDKIQFINKAVGAKRGILSIANPSTKSYINENDTYKTEVITISDVLNDYNFPADILKMDCEGCEFEIILNEDLTMFKDIVFEHHSKIAGKDFKPLIEKLKNDGFKIDTYTVGASELEFEDIGIIHAYK